MSILKGGVSVQGALSEGSLSTGVSVLGRFSVQEGLNLGISVWGSLSGGGGGFSVQGVSVQREICPPPVNGMTDVS